MNAKLTSTKLRKHTVIGDVKTIEILGNKIKIIDIYEDEHIFNADEWACVCSEWATCSHCGKTFFYDGETCAIYRNTFICNECYQNYYGYCNECGELNKYTDMNEDIVCKGCE